MSSATAIASHAGVRDRFENTCVIGVTTIMTWCQHVVWPVHGHAHPFFVRERATTGMPCVQRERPHVATSTISVYPVAMPEAALGLLSHHS